MKPFLTGGCVCLLMAVAGCSKDSNQFIASPFSDTTWVRQINPANTVARLSDTLHIQPSADSVDLPAGDTSILSGLQCILPPGEWQTQAGSVFQGRALLQGQFLQKPGDWIRNFVSTTYQGKLIHTSGVLYLNVRSVTGALQPVGQIRATFPVSNPTQVDSLFYGSYANNTLQWAATLPDVYNSRGESDLNGTVQYTQTFGTQKTGWLLSGVVPAESTNYSSQLVVVLPNQFSNANSAVFCLLKDLPALVAFTGDYSSRTFIASNLPVGATAMIISLTFTGDSFYLGTKTVSLSGGTDALSLSPALETLPSLIQYLGQL